MTKGESRTLPAMPDVNVVEESDAPFLVKGDAEPAGRVEVQGVSKVFGTAKAVESTSFVVPAGTFVTLLGPSGSGKTTILKMIAGFEEPSTGKVLISGRDVTRVPPHKRNLGFVFQQYALFPHLTVADNVAYSLRMRRVPASEVRNRVAEVLKLMRLTEFGTRYPAQLSGGQQQRVALARAIVFRPPVLLMDEPMAALDKRLREEMQFEIRRLQRQLGITTIVVTHDQTEALVMSDSIIVLNKGSIEQSGSPEEVYKKPCTRFVANFIGESNIIHGVARRQQDRAWLVCERDLHLPLVPNDVAEGARLIYVVRPESVGIGAAKSSDAIVLKGRVLETIFSGDAVRTLIDVGLTTPLSAKLLTKSGAPAPSVGEELSVSWDAADAIVIHA